MTSSRLIGLRSAAIGLLLLLALLGQRAAVLGGLGARQFRSRCPLHDPLRNADGKHAGKPHGRSRERDRRPQESPRYLKELIGPPTRDRVPDNAGSYGVREHG